MSYTRKRGPNKVNRINKTVSKYSESYGHQTSKDNDSSQGKIPIWGKTDK